VSAAPGIQVLPQSAAERIAAGEVVERPASVVKELIENSLDAGARRIAIEIGGAGQRLIQISDDGAGIPGSEVSLAFQRFATSKIRTAEDLRHVHTYGFRGEALPSIAAVARVQMVTRIQGADAVKIVIAGGTQQGLGPASGPQGTTVIVEGLFFNTPARRRFLKSPARERAVIVETVEGPALAAPEVAFRLTDEGQEILWCPPESFADRARRVLGPEVAAHALEFTATGATGTLAGVLGTPQVAQRRRTHQWFLVNNRPVRSPLLARALAQAYHTLIPEDRHPAAVLSVRVAPEDVDANVHPRKAEVRFVRERQLFEDVEREVRRTLHRVPLLHVIPAQPPDALSRAAAAGGREDVPAHAVGRGDHGVPQRPPLTADALEITDASSSDLPWPPIRVIGQLALTYILGQSGKDLVLIDQHAAHERVLFEQLIARRAREGVQAQGLVTPIVLELTPQEAAVLTDLEAPLRSLGFDVELFGPKTVRLMAVPAIAGHRAPGEVFRACLRDLQDDHGPHAGRSLEERLTIATACHTAVRAGDALDPTMMAGLLDALSRAADPFSCFHGRPTMVRVRATEIERWFYRRG